MEAVPYVQCSHVFRVGAAQGKPGEDDPGEDQNIPSSIYVAHLGDANGKPYKAVLEESNPHDCNFMIRTHIGQQIRQHNPRCIDKVIQVIRYRDEGRRHNGCIESRDQKANEEPTSVRTARSRGMEPYLR
jgi:hypothetical protein